MQVYATKTWILDMPETPDTTAATNRLCLFFCSSQLAGHPLANSAIS